MNKVYTVFISSTYEDLKEYRQAAIQAVLSLGHLPLVMENFNSRPFEPKEVIRSYLEKTDYFILILGNCYGSIIKEDNISYTEFEYNEAKRLEIPTLVFFANSKINLSDDKDVCTRLNLENIDYDLRYKKLNEFRDKLKTTRSYFKSIEDLKALIISSLSITKDECERPGWIRGGSISNISEYTVKVNLVKDKIKSDEYEKIKNKLFNLNQYLYPSSKTMPMRPIKIIGDDYLICICFIIKAETLFVAQKRKEQFEEFVKDEVFFHSCDLELFNGFSKIKIK